MTCQICGKRITAVQHPVLGLSYVDSKGQGRCPPKNPKDWLAVQLAPDHLPKKETA